MGLCKNSWSLFFALTESDYQCLQKKGPPIKVRVHPSRCTTQPKGESFVCQIILVWNKMGN